MIFKIAIGSANFGMQYGITNQSGELSSDVIYQILEKAKTNGINTIDTALMYKQAHAKLGLYNNLSQFNVVSKIKGVNSFNETSEMLNKVLQTLNLNKIYAVLLHNSAEIFQNGVFDALNEFKENKMVTKIGVSVYNPDEILKIVEKYKIDLVQLPLNILNQQFTNILKQLKENGIEIHVRSLFLQGVLLEPEKFTEKFGTAILKYINFLKQFNLKPIEACYIFAQHYQHFIDKICIGVESLYQLDQTFSTINSIKQSVNFNFSELSCNKDYITNPSFW